MGHQRTLCLTRPLYFTRPPFYNNLGAMPMENNGKARFPLDASVLQRLDNIALLTHRPIATGRPGRRRSPLAGSSMEFSDYRRYAPGDDFRRIDWRAYARLEDRKSTRLNS